MKILTYKLEEPFLFESEREMDTPTINKKNGKTKSVGVAPCHSACSKGAYTCDQLPGSLTIIIPAIVNPLKKSNDNNLFIFQFLKDR